MDNMSLQDLTKNPPLFFHLLMNMVVQHLIMPKFLTNITNILLIIGRNTSLQELNLRQIDMFFTIGLDSSLMPYRRGRKRIRYSSRNPIQSFKQVYNNSVTLVAATNDFSFDFVDGVDAAATAATNKEVPTGSIIRSFDINLQGQNTSGTGVYHFYIAQARHGQGSADFPAPNAVGGSSVRNQIIYQGMIAFGSNDGKPVAVHRRFKVPPHMQRVRKGDSWFVVQRSTVALGMNAQIIYKFYR